MAAVAEFGAPVARSEARRSVRQAPKPSDKPSNPRPKPSTSGRKASSSRPKASTSRRGASTSRTRASPRRLAPEGEETQRRQDAKAQKTPEFWSFLRLGVFASWRSLWEASAAPSLQLRERVLRLRQRAGLVRVERVAQGVGDEPGG